MNREFSIVKMQEREVTIVLKYFRNLYILWQILKNQHQVSLKTYLWWKIVNFARIQSFRSWIISLAKKYSLKNHCPEGIFFTLVQSQEILNSLHILCFLFALCHTCTFINIQKTNELLHDRTNKMTFAPSEDSDQTGHLSSLISRCCGLNGWLRNQAFFMRTVKTLIRLGRCPGCPGWSESSLGAQTFLLVLSCSISNHQYLAKNNLWTLSEIINHCTVIMHLSLFSPQKRWGWQVYIPWWGLDSQRFIAFGNLTEFFDTGVRLKIPQLKILEEI